MTGRSGALSFVFAVLCGGGALTAPLISLAAADLYSVEQISGAELWGRPLSVGTYVTDKKAVIATAMDSIGWEHVREGRNFVRARFQVGKDEIVTHIVLDERTLVIDPVSDRRLGCSGGYEKCRVNPDTFNTHLADLRDAIAQEVHEVAIHGQGR